MAEEGLRQRVFKDSVWNLATTILSRFGGLIFTILLARFLLPEGFGVYSLATSVALMFLTFADLGINQAMIRFVSLEMNRNKKKATAYFQYLAKFKIFASIIIALLLFALSYPLAYYVFHKPELLFAFIALSFYIFLLSLQTFFESLFYINNKVSIITLKEASTQILRIVLLILLFYIFSKFNPLRGVFIILIITTFLVILITLFLSKKYFGFLFEKLSIFGLIFRKSSIVINQKSIIKFVGSVTLINLSLTFFSYIDTMMLGYFVSAEYIGYYRAAFTLILGIMSLLAFTNIFLPILARISSEQIGDVFNKIIHYTMILAIPAVTGFYFLLNYIIRAVYGYEYLNSSISLIILLPLIVFATIVGDLQTLFSARGKPEKLLFLILSITILNILLNYLLISYFLKYSELYAIGGAALATLLSWLAYFIGALYLCKKEFGLTLRLNNFLRPIIASIIMAIFLISFNSHFSDLNLFLGILEIISGIIIYLIAFFLLGGIKKEDVVLFNLLIKNYSNFSKR